MQKQHINHEDSVPQQTGHLSKVDSSRSDKEDQTPSQDQLLKEIQQIELELPVIS
jgi:hypothetical protein